MPDNNLLNLANILAEAVAKDIKKRYEDRFFELNSEWTEHENEEAHKNKKCFTCFYKSKDFTASIFITPKYIYEIRKNKVFGWDEINVAIV